METVFVTQYARRSIMGHITCLRSTYKRTRRWWNMKSISQPTNPKEMFQSFFWLKYFCVIGLIIYNLGSPAFPTKIQFKGIKKKTKKQPDLAFFSSARMSSQPTPDIVFPFTLAEEDQYSSLVRVSSVHFCLLKWCKLPAGLQGSIMVSPRTVNILQKMQSKEHKMFLFPAE